MRQIFALLILAPLILHERTAFAVDYLAEIKPLLTEKCSPCHGTLKQESGLRVETRELMIQGGDSGSILDLDAPENSPLIERVSSRDSDRMPPEGEGAALTADQIAMLTKWIQQGAPAPAETPPVAPKDHWAFQPIKPAPELVDGGDANPIDAILNAKHATLGIAPQSPATREIQIRRLYLDLIGLPPSPEQLADQRALRVIIDDLLASPQHGERWARHWMDIWRYSDWYGLGQQLRNSQKHLWHWRDWIIHSLNDDKGYDQMVREMLAGDELAPENPSVLAATGYLARNYYLFNRTTWLDSTIEHTSKAFLGLTMNCAKCHDHKYDPISHVDYYKMRAIFEPHQVRLDPVPGVTDLESDGLPRAFDDQLDLPTHLHRKGDPKDPDKETVINAGIPSIFAEQQPKIESVNLPAQAYAPATRPHVLEDQLTKLSNEIKVAEKAVQDAKAKWIEIQQHSLDEDASQSDATLPPEPMMLIEEFDQLDQDRWELVGNHWEFRDGKLLQTVPTRDAHFAKLKQKLPRDFEANCYYTHTGGTTYRSVTFRFDESADGQNSNFVYTSAHAPGPKVQVASTRNGQSDYPANGRKSYAIEEGKPYHLRFAVKDTLINVWLDGELVIAYQFPKRLDGTFSLSGFDSTVSFDRLTIQNPSKDIQWVKPENFKEATPAPEKALQIAEAKLYQLRSKRDSIEATINADKLLTALGTSPRKPHQETDKASDDGTEKTVAARLHAAKKQLQLRIAEAKLKQLESGKDETDSIKKEEEKLRALDQANPNQVTYTSFRASRKALESPADKETDYSPIYPSVSSGRRSALANWITSPNNPLTARVAVNHVWMRHFGQPLVESVFDFGLRAKSPEHLELLDTLAFNLMQSGWSLKQLHRTIVTSEAYLRSSSSLSADPKTQTQDPQNQMYWRMNAKRMESQLLRDSLLSLSGQLDLTVGGPSLDHNHQPPRRGLYLRHSPDVKDQFLETFDNANVLACYRRSESIVPQQALALVNSKISLEAAQKLNQILHEKYLNLSDKSFVKMLFEYLLAREATDQEIDACTNFLNQLSTKQATDGEQIHRASTAIRERLVHAMLNHHEFITIR